jgi:hypothetical protein
LSPVQLGVHSDWARVLPGGAQSFVWKQDGSAWVIRETGKAEDPTLLGGEIAPGMVIQSVPSLNNLRFRSLHQMLRNVFEVGLREDGTLWLADYPNETISNLGSATATKNSASRPGLAQIGKDSDWAAVASGFLEMVALKTDGSLWLWKTDWDSMSQFAGPRWGPNFAGTMARLLEQPPERLGKHHDWVGLGIWRSNITTLAADGSLWLWRRSDLPSYRHGIYSEDFTSSWLAPTRKPLMIENIFPASN